MTGSVLFAAIVGLVGVALLALAGKMGGDDHEQ